MKKILVLTGVLTIACGSICMAKVVKNYYPDGKIKSVMRYNDKKLLDGPYKIYWDNGTVKEIGAYHNGVHAPQVKRYTIDGDPVGQ